MKRAFILTAAVVIGVFVALQASDTLESPGLYRTAFAEDDGGLPPLTVGEDAPRLKEGDDEEEKGEPKADNFPCYVCHGNYQEESLAQTHAYAGVGCMECHGSSEDHRGDEENTTPPDRMFPAEDINPFCRRCHEEHDVAPEKVVARWQERRPDKELDREPVCTDCHGEHRLDLRTVRWNKRTGEVLPPKERDDGEKESKDEASDSEDAD